MITDYTNLVATILKEKKDIDKSSSYISLWKKWYRGEDPSFHTYYVYNGEKKHKKKRLSLHMGKKVCEDWASLLMNEKVKIVVKENEELDKLLIDLDFWTKANKSIEYGFALSQSALELTLDNIGIDDDGLIKDISKVDIMLDVHNAFNIIPISSRNGNVVECAFVSKETNKTIINIHKLNNEGNYNVIRVVIDNITNKQQILEFHFNSPKPLFVILKPNIVNNLELEYNYPISILGNSIDTLRAIDMVFDSYHSEFELGRKRVYVSSKMFKVDPETGDVQRVFDPNDLVVYQLPEEVGANGEKRNMIESVSDTIRSTEHDLGIQFFLNLLSSQVGLGVDYYRFEKGRVMTATQVISEKSDTFRNMKKHEIVLEKALTTLTSSLMWLYNNFKQITFSDIENIEIKFDDSVIEDKTTEQNNDRTDVNNGIMSRIEYRMKWYGEDEETATEYIKKHFGDSDLLMRINNFINALNSGAMTYLQFVENVYPDYPNKEELALQLEQLSSKSGNITPEDLMGGGFYQPPAE